MSDPEKKENKPDPAKAADTDAPAVASAPAEKDNLDQFKDWALQKTGKAKESALAVYDAAKKFGLSIDLNDNGVPDLSEVMPVIQEKTKALGEEGKDLWNKTSEGAKYLKDETLAIWQEKGPEVGKLLSDNKFSLLGGALGALLMMLLFEAGPIMALIIGALAFGAMSAMGADENGVVKNMMSGPAEVKKNEPGQGADIKKGGEEPAAGQDQARNHDKVHLKSHENHQSFYVDENGQWTKSADGADAKVTGRFRKNDKDELEFHLTHMAVRDPKTHAFMESGSDEPRSVRVHDTVLPVSKDNRLDLKNEDVKATLKSAREQAIKNTRDLQRKLQETDGKETKATGTDAAKTASGRPLKTTMAEMEKETVATGITRIHVYPTAPVATFMVNEHYRKTNDENEAIGVVRGVMEGNLFKITHTAVRDENGNFKKADGKYDMQPVTHSGVTPRWAQFTAKDNIVDLAGEPAGMAVHKALGNAQLLQNENVRVAQVLKETDRLAAEQKEIAELKKEPLLKRIAGTSLTDGDTLATYAYTFVNDQNQKQTYMLHGREKPNGDIMFSSATPKEGDTKSLGTIIVKPNEYSLVPLIHRKTSTGALFATSLNAAIDKAFADDAKPPVADKTPTSLKPSSPLLFALADKITGLPISAGVSLAKEHKDMAIDQLSYLTHTAPNKSGTPGKDTTKSS